jgi:hypothetical protein
MRRLLREPLLQFLVLGAMLFAAYHLVGRQDVEAPEKIVVSSSRIANLADGFARTWRRPPSEQELQGLIEDYIRDEVFYRAGRAAGLDRDDVVIRRRVRQKMEFLAEEVSAPQPTEAQLADFLASNPERFRKEDRLTFQQLYLNPSQRAGAIDRDIEHISAVLARGETAIDTAGLGDPFLLGDEFRDVSLRDTTNSFGDGFAPKSFHGRTGALARADRLELWAAFRLCHGADEGQRPAARCHQAGGRATVGRSAPDRNRAEALPHAARSI